MNLGHIKTILQQGGVIAYPTEAVFGLGCDPLNESAVKKLLQIKNRSINKGLILIAADYQQIKPYIQELAPEKMQAILNTWPGAFTWIFKSSSLTPKWIRGDHETVAVRVTNHPIAKQICQAFAGAIVSTSANVAEQAPARTAAEVAAMFEDGIDLIVDAECGSNKNPTQIRNALTGEIFRQ